MVLLKPAAAGATLYFMIQYTGSTKSVWTGIDIKINRALANLACFHLLGHAGLALFITLRRI